MNNHESSQKLKKASALLNMLERLMLELGRSPEQGDGIPWEGMKLTLSQSRKQIESVQRDLSSKQIVSEKARSAIGYETSADALLQSSPLAKRIKKLPARKKRPPTSVQT